MDLMGPLMFRKQASVAQLSQLCCRTIGTIVRQKANCVGATIEKF